MNYPKLTWEIFKTINFKQTKSVRNCSKFSIVSTNKDNLIVKFGQNIEHYPLVWLRDNCTCPQCFHQDSFSRIIDWTKFEINVGVKKIETDKSNEEVLIEWDDNHKSLFSFKWLNTRKFLKKCPEESQNDRLNKPTKILWSGNDLLQIAKKYDYEDVMNSDESLHNWIKDLAVYGTVFTNNASLDKKANRQLAEKIAFIRKTHYEEEFRVISKTGTNNVAYLASALQFHTDLPYYEYVPGVINLHCITQCESKGGESLLCDGFYMAEKLRIENKPVFDILSTVEVDWLDVGKEDGKKFHSDFRSPMISLDKHGNVEKIRHSVPQRNSRFSVELDMVKPWYEALRVFIDMLNTHSCKFKLKPGEMFAFDNTRMLHGREGYQDTESKQRYMLGLYMDWDELYSKLRVLRNTTEC